jgi:hypothetical protein
MRSFPRLSRLAIVAATVAVYAWFVHAWRTDRPQIITPPNSAIQTAIDANFYGLLARGFLRGHLYLDAEPPAALVAAVDPYTPAKRPLTLYLHDASFYRGKYYIYFGPSPAVLAYVPWRLLTGHDLPTPWAVWFFVAAAYLGAIALFAAIRREYFSAASGRAMAAAYLALGSATLWLPLVRRPGVYEAAIACGSAATVWAWYAAWRSRTAARSLGWAAACGALVGVAIAARPTFGVAALPALMLMRKTGGRWLDSFRDRRAWAAAAAGTVIVAALLAYNHARFGAWLEFGQKYQLSSENEGAIQHFSLRFWPAQAWFYLLAPLRWSEYFPFIRDVAAARLPPGFGGHEYSFGLLTNLPVLWFGVVALVIGFRRNAPTAAIAAFGVGAVLALAPLLTFFGSCVRYQAEFAPPLTLLATMGIIAGDQMLIGSPRGRRRFGLGALVLAGFSGLVVFFAAIDMYDGAVDTPPPAFDRLGRWLDRPIVARHLAKGETVGAIELELEPGTVGRAEPLIIASGPAGAAESLWIEHLADGTARFTVQREGPEAFTVTGTAPLADPAPHVVRATFGALYPVRPIEMPSATARDDFRSLKLWVRVDVDGRRIIDQAMPAAPWRTRQVALAPEAHRGDTAFSGRVLAVRRLPLAPRVAAIDRGGVRLRANIDATLAGHSVPLAVTGYQGRGDFLFARIEAGPQLRFGYDHWGKPGLESPPISVSAGPHTIEFWMPPIIASDRATPLEVRIDGKPAWQVWVPFYPAGPEEFFIARNPLGGSSCEREFSGATIERTDLPAR